MHPIIKRSKLKEIKCWEIELVTKLDRDIVNQATKPTQSNVWFPIITEHDVFLHMTRFLHISLFAVTCFTCYSQQEGIKMVFNIWYYRFCSCICDLQINI